MLDSKFFFTLIGLIIAVFAVCNTSFTPPIQEGFGGLPSRTVRVETEVYPSGAKGQGYGVSTNYQAQAGDLKFFKQPNYQSLLSPRSASLNYGANINYRMPSYENQAIPSDPMALGDMAKQGYNKANSNVKTVDSVPTNSYGGDYGEVSDMLPVSDMGQIGVGVSSGNPQNEIVYERYVYANKKSRLHGAGDFIRGDLAIAPNPKSGWFNVSVEPHIDLNGGALGVMGGDNPSTRALSNLFSVSSGHSSAGKYVGGIDMSQTQNYSTSLSGGMGRDVNVTSFL